MVMRMMTIAKAAAVRRSVARTKSIIMMMILTVMKLHWAIFTRKGKLVAYILLVVLLYSFLFYFRKRAMRKATSFYKDLKSKSTTSSTATKRNKLPETTSSSSSGKIVDDMDELDKYVAQGVKVIKEADRRLATYNNSQL
jgi:Ca2+/Na+ antiporter